MKAKSKNREVKFPIGIKLIAVISLLIVSSFVLSMVVVTVNVSNDVRVSAEENNFTINARSAGAAESYLSTVRSDVFFAFGPSEHGGRLRVPCAAGVVLLF